MTLRGPDGELVESEPDRPRHDCRDGWLPPPPGDPDERPRPCLICRPHLVTITVHGRRRVIRRGPGEH